jgi:predicted RNase H-like HicB family nuclease
MPTECRRLAMIVDKSRAGYVIVFEKARYNWSAFVPDLPGCITTGRTLEKTKNFMEEAITLHQRGMRQDRIRVPRPRSLETLRRKRLV